MSMKGTETFNRLCSYRMMTDINTTSGRDGHCKADGFTNDSLTRATNADVVECLMGVITKSQEKISSPDIPHRRIQKLVEESRTTEQNCIRSPLRENHHMISTVTTLMSDEEDHSDVTSINSFESSSSKVYTPNMFVPQLGVVGLPSRDEKAGAGDTTFSVCAALSESSTIFDSADTLVGCTEGDPCINECMSTPQTSILLVEKAEKSPETSHYGSYNAAHKAGKESFGFTFKDKKRFCEYPRIPYCHSYVACFVGKDILPRPGNTFKTTIPFLKGYNEMQTMQSTEAIGYSVAPVGNALEDEQESIVSVCVSPSSTVNQSVSTIQAHDMATTKHIQRCSADEAEEEARCWISSRRTALGQLRAEMAKNQAQTSQATHFAASKYQPSGEKRGKEGDNTLYQANTVHHLKDVDSTYETPSRGDNRGEGSTLPHSMDLSTHMTTLSPRKDARVGTVRVSPHNFSSISHISMDGAIHDAPSVVVECSDLFLDDNLMPHEGVQECKVLSEYEHPIDLLGATFDSRSRRVDTDGDHRKRILVSSDQSYHVLASPSRLAHVPSGADTQSTGFQTYRHEKLKREKGQRNIVECTFHPIISPGSQAIMQAAAAAAQRSANKCSSTLEEEEGPLRPVYERLYPAHLSAEAAIRRHSEEEATHRHEIEKELFLLRQRCGASYNPKPLHHQTSRSHSGRHKQFETFAGFLSNIFQSGLVSLSPNNTLKADQHVVFVESAYRSPMAIAIEEEEASQSQRGAKVSSTRDNQNGVSSSFSSSMMDKYFSGQDTICQPHRACDAITERFAEFLDRQNMHHVRHERTVSMLEKEMTPHFTPQTTLKSARLMQDMINRSVLHNSSGSNTSDWIQRCRANHIPLGSALVSKHMSSYVNPCSFSPRVSSAARTSSRHECSRESEPARNKKATFQRLYESHNHLIQAREIARRRAEEEKTAECSFKPVLNTRKNAQVSSLLKPNAYNQHREYLKQRRETQIRLKKEMEAKKKDQELGPCTFKPQVSRKPAYISKMASSFRLVRRLNIEF
ncbi:unnamed protein product [Phytomonas sp. EM1]|nr:unnamed protein product [Phytomonas sp. EM1]|eukprot:CCW62816.1 unnamed protein product [Phytomonas sp. isolate EM1]